MQDVLYIGVDLQEGFLTDEIRQTDYVKRVEQFLQAQNKDAIILTRFVNEPDNNFVKLLNWPKMQQNDPNIKLIGNLEQQRYEIVEKPTYTSWIPIVQQKAEKLGVNKCVIFGLDSHACVLKTALDIFETAYEPVVLGDLCHSSDGEAHDRMGLNLLKILLGVNQVINSSELRQG